MTRYTVTWHRESEEELMILWLEATDRDDVAAAVRAIDLALSNDPGSQGEVVAEGLRSLNAPPLRVLFVVREPDRAVQVELVRRI